MPAHWTGPTRVAFRFSVIYFGLFMLATQVAGGLIPGIGFRGFGPLWPMREITTFVAATILGLDRPQPPVGVGAETPFFWVQTSWILAVAVVVTVLWSRIDRRRTDYRAAHQWFRLAVRMALAAQMFEYGLTKVIPTQFPAPSLATLVTPAGDLSLSASLWTTIGAAPAYEVFTGCAELLGGVLLLAPRTTLAGAIICLANLIHVLVLNLTFDIGLKLTTIHLVALASVLVAPDLGRLAQVFVFNRPTRASEEPALFAGRRANRAARLAQLAFGILLIAAHTYLNAAYWNVRGGGAPKSALYGVWDVVEMEVDGEVGPAVLNEYDRQWRRAIFDLPGEVIFQRFDDSLARYGAVVDPGGRIRLTKGGSRTWGAELEYMRVSDDELHVRGRMDGRDIRLRLERVPLDSFRLLNSHFRWTRSQTE